jgi:alkaline phosphatase D
MRIKLTMLVFSSILVFAGAQSVNSESPNLSVPNQSNKKTQEELKLRDAAPEGTNPEIPTIKSKDTGDLILRYWNKNTPEEISLYEAAFAILSSDKDASFKNLVSSKEFMERCQKDQVKLLGGPLLGAVSSTGVSIWVRSVKPSTIVAEVTDGKNKFRSAPVSSSFDSDLSAVLKFETLKPLTSYAYKLIINDTLEVTNTGYSFKTLPAETDRTDVRIAFGSCFHRSSLGNEPFYQTISSTNPSAMLLLGDIAVQDRNNKIGLHRADYLLRDFHPAWKDFVCKVPVFATWDDHDYFGNDKAGIPEGYTNQDRENVRKVFCNSWNNPSYGLEGKGLFFRTRIGPCDVIMLDERYFRTGQKGSFLGEQQTDWLKKQLLDCKGPFIILSCGTMWSDYVSAGKDSWGVWDPEGREVVFKFIEDNNISGVLLISGDRHGARGFTIPRESGFTFYEFEAASLGGRSAESESIGKWDTELYGIVGVFAFGEFTFTTSTSVPEVTFRLIKQGGDVIYKKTLTVDELTPSKKMKKIKDAESNKKP